MSWPRLEVVRVVTVFDANENRGKECEGLGEITERKGFKNQFLTVLEGRFFQVEQDQARARMVSNEDKFQDLLADFKAFKKDFGNFVTEHYNPMQKLGDELAS